MKHLHSPFSIFDSAHTSAFAELVLRNAVSQNTYPLIIKALNEGWFVDKMEQVNGKNLLAAYLETYPEKKGAWGVSLTTREEAESSQMVKSDDGSYVLNEPLLTAKHIMDSGVDPWEQDSDGRDSFDQLFGLQWTKMMDVFLTHEHAPSVETLYSRTHTIFNDKSMPWLHSAIQYNHIGLAEHLVKKYHFPVNQLDEHGRPPLFYVNSPEMAEFILQCDVDLTIADNNGENVNSFWNQKVSNNEYLSEMSQSLGKAMQGLPQDTITKIQKPTLFQMAARGNKNVFLRFLKSNKFSVDSKIILQNSEHSLMAFTAIKDMQTDSPSQAILRFIVEHSQDPLFESMAGIPDILLASMSMNKINDQHGINFRPTIHAMIDQAYPLNSKGQFDPYIQDYLSAAQKIIQIVSKNHPAKLYLLYNNILTPFINKSVNHLVFTSEALFQSDEATRICLLNFMTFPMNYSNINAMTHILNNCRLRDPNSILRLIIKTLQSIDSRNPELYRPLITLNAYTEDLYAIRHWETKKPIEYCFKEQLNVLLKDVPMPPMDDDLAFRVECLKKNNPATYAQIESKIILSHIHTSAPSASTRRARM